MYCHNDILDAGLTKLRENVSAIYVCTGNPQTYTEASNQMMASRTIDRYSFSDPMDAVDGRKIIMYEQSDLEIMAAGDARYVCFVETSSTVLWYSVRRTMPKNMTIGTIMTIGAADIIFKRQQLL